MNKKVIYIIIAISLLLIAGGGYYYYYHNYVETITDYYRFTYEPPHEEPSFFGKRYSDPKVEIGKVEYTSDSIALKKEKEWAKGGFEGYGKMLEEELKKPMPTTSAEEMEHQLKVKAYAELLELQYSLIIISHTRNYNAEEFIEVVRKKGLRSREAEEYQKSHKIKVKIERTF